MFLLIIYPFQSSIQTNQKPKLGVVGEGKVYESRLPRYHQLVTLDEQRRGVPGPGRYDISSQFIDRMKKLNTFLANKNLKNNNFFRSKNQSFAS